MAAPLVERPPAPVRPRRSSGTIGLAIAAAIILGTGLAAALPSAAAPVGSSGTSEPVIDRCATPVLPLTVDAETAARLDAVLARIDEQLTVPGIGAAVVFPDGRVWAAGRGYASIETKTPVTPATAFAFASAGKTAIAALVLRAAERHELSLLDAVADLLPAARISPRATVADLLRHRSGLGDYLTSGSTEAAMAANPDAMLDPNDLVASAGSPRVPGSFDYSNTGYLYAAALLERGGESYLARLHRELLDPFALCSIGNPSLEVMTLPIARGYEARDGGWSPVASDPAMGPGRAVLSAAGPAGGLVGTPTDLARMGAVVMGEGFLSAATLDRAYAPYPGTYGLGFTRYSIAGRAIMGHDGRLGGVRSALRYDPASGIAVVLCYNRADPSPGDAVALLVAAALR
jgi:CubicO group peptidase (beta-lactamase class C family)